MQEGEFEKTRMLRAPESEAHPASPRTDAAPDPNATVMIQPSARAVSAAAALAEARRKRQAEQQAEEFHYSGQVDFDVTANDIPVVPPRPRSRWRPAAVIVTLLVLLVVTAAIWWGWPHAARIVPVR